MISSSLSSSSSINVTRTKTVKVHILFTKLRQGWTVPGCEKDIWLYDSFVIFIDRMPFEGPTFDNADPLFALVITAPGWGDESKPS